MVIWILDCCSGCITKVTLSEEKEEELNRFLDEENGDMESFLSKYSDQLGISVSNSSWMITNQDYVYQENL